MIRTRRLVAASCCFAVFAVHAGGHAQASCVVPKLFNTGYSYLYTPGCESVDCGSSASSITDDLLGSFWILGAGDPATMFVGVDNGTFPALGGWVYTYPGYPASIFSTWAADARIDGCIAFADPPYCMAVLLGDVDPLAGDGTFALITDKPDGFGNYDLSQPGDIVLSAIPRPTITGSMSSDTQGLVFIQGPSLDDLDPGLYLDPECDTLSDGSPVALIRGYRVYHRQSPVESAPPATRAVADWTALTDVLPLGEPTMVRVNCAAGAADQWLAIGLEFDSGFIAHYLSSPSTRIACGPNLADPEDLPATGGRYRLVRPTIP